MGGGFLGVLPQGFEPGVVVALRNDPLERHRTEPVRRGSRQSRKSGPGGYGREASRSLPGVGRRKTSRATE